MSQYLEIIKRYTLHHLDLFLVSVESGTNLISEILKVPGASKSVLEAYVSLCKGIFRLLSS